MIKKQLKDFFTCLLHAFIAGACFGIAFGMYNYCGQYYFSIAGAINAFVLFFLVFFIVNLQDKLKQY